MPLIALAPSLHLSYQSQRQLMANSDFCMYMNSVKCKMFILYLGDKWSFTLVDCPGHSSLIRTVIGGAQIMDIMLLVIDINKGMQPQTAECLILAQITSHHLIVVLNKIDMIPIDQRATKVLSSFMVHVFKTFDSHSELLYTSCMAFTIIFDNN